MNDNNDIVDRLTALTRLYIRDYVSVDPKQIAEDIEFILQFGVDGGPFSGLPIRTKGEN